MPASVFVVLCIFIESWCLMDGNRVRTCLSVCVCEYEQLFLNLSEVPSSLYFLWLYWIQNALKWTEFTFGKIIFSLLLKAGCVWPLLVFTYHFIRKGNRDSVSKSWAKNPQLRVFSNLTSFSPLSQRAPKLCVYFLIVSASYENESSHLTIQIWMVEWNLNIGGIDWR